MKRHKQHPQAMKHPKRKCTAASMHDPINRSYRHATMRLVNSERVQKERSRKRKKLWKTERSEREKEKTDQQ